MLLCMWPVWADGQHDGQREVCVLRALIALADDSSACEDGPDESTVIRRCSPSVMHG